MTESVTNQRLNLGKLARYGCAAGAGALASTTALAQVFDFDPVGGLPITIDTTFTEISPLQVDVDGDTVVDFNIFYTTAYGGGFQIRAVDSGDLLQRGGVQSSQASVNSDYLNLAQRNDLTEYVAVNKYSTTGIYADVYRGSRVFIARGAILDGFPAYNPFREKPGFLGLMLGTLDNDTGRAATLKVSVNADASQLSILSGHYRQDEYDLYLDDGVLSEDGFEDYPESPYFPPAALQGLASGDAGAAHD